MTDYKKSLEPELEIQYFDDNILWIGASGVAAFSEGETMARGLILEYDREGTAVGVVLTRSALEKLKSFLHKDGTAASGVPPKGRKVPDGAREPAKYSGETKRKAPDGTSGDQPIPENQEHRP